MLKIIFKLILFSVSLFAFNAFAAKGILVNLASVSPAGTPWAQVLEDIKSEIVQKSENKIEVKTQFGAQRGGESEILDGLRRGRIQGSNLTSLSIGSVVPEFNVLEIPFLFESNEEADYVLDNYLIGPFRELFSKKGLVLAAWGENGWRNIGMRTKHIKRPADLESIKIRAAEGEANLIFWKK
jgi:TRAP-type C4-dicarboxylate transport system substrate-binding protein